MNEEIKSTIEIFDEMIDEAKYEVIYVQKTDLKLLLDYITNLQQKYDMALEDSIKESHRRMELETEKEQLNSLVNSCQDEIRKLKEKIKHYEETTTFGDYVKEVNLLVDYKSRCKKATEYVEEHIKYECDDAFNGKQFFSHHLYDFSKEDLLNILNGKSDE